MLHKHKYFSNCKVTRLQMFFSDLFIYTFSFSSFRLLVVTDPPLPPPTKSLHNYSTTTSPVFSATPRHHTTTQVSAPPMHHDSLCCSSSQQWGATVFSNISLIPLCVRPSLVFSVHLMHTWLFSLACSLVPLYLVSCSTFLLFINYWEAASSVIIMLTILPSQA